MFQRIVGTLTTVRIVIAGFCCLGALGMAQGVLAAAGFDREVLARDDFDGKSTLRWTVRRADPQAASFDKRPGYLTITTQAGDIIGPNRTARNVHLTPAPNPIEGVVVTTCVDDFRPAEAWNQAGLLCYSDDDNYLKFTIESETGGRRKLVMIREISGIATVNTASDVNLDAARIWLRMELKRSNALFFASCDGEKFKLCGSLHIASGGRLNAPNSVGVLAVNGPESAAPRVDASFDFFEICRADSAQSPLAWTRDEAIHQLKLYPRDPYLQYVAMQLALREGRVPETDGFLRGMMRWQAGPGSSGARDVDLFSMFSGALAVQESLQLEEMGAGGGARPLGTRSAVGQESVAVADLDGPTIQSHPWKEMLAGRKPDISPLARSVPADFYFVHFQSVDKLFDVMGSTDLWGTQLLQQSVQSSANRPISAKIQRQLGLDVAPELRSLYAASIEAVAVSGSDLFLRDGSDVTLLFQLKQPAAFRAQMKMAEAAIARLTPGVKRTQVVVRGVGVDHLASPDGTIHVYSADPTPTLHVRSNSLVAIGRILGAIQEPIDAGGEIARLGDTDEFAYIRTLMPRGAIEEDGFVYLSDPFIRRMVGPEIKLTERRRRLCYNHLRMIGHAALMYATETGKTPQSISELVA
ncbi:MAG: DUF1349 domain-containing protein, partial [Planctomycetales bacterium]|nr:DUF1349 domain-containing protein [Planctomycetales bacterium]